MSQPWEQRDDETTKAYQAFSVYMRLGPDRSQAALWEKLRKPGQSDKRPGHLARWSAEHEWVDRAKAWDRHWNAERIKQAADQRQRALAEVIDNVPLLTKRLVQAALEGDSKATRACLDALGVVGIAPSREPVQLTEAKTAPEEQTPEEWAEGGLDDSALDRLIWGT